MAPLLLLCTYICTYVRMCTMPPLLCVSHKLDLYFMIQVHRMRCVYYLQTRCMNCVWVLIRRIVYYVLMYETKLVAWLCSLLLFVFSSCVHACACCVKHVHTYLCIHIRMCVHGNCKKIISCECLMKLFCNLWEV